jgi:hypothetical protein
LSQVPIAVSDGIHSTRQTLIIRVTNESSQSDALKFTATEYRTSIVENVFLDTLTPLLVLSIATSNDLDVPITYRILNSRPEFILSPTSGLLSWTGASVDREQTPHIRLIVQVVLIQDEQYLFSGSIT